MFCVYMPAMNSTVATSDTPDLIDNPCNPILRGLAVSQDQTGQIISIQVYGIPRPNILIARADGKELRNEHVTAMWTYATETLENTPTFEAFLDELTVEKFIKFWNEHPVYKTYKEGCPVSLRPSKMDPLGFVIAIPKKQQDACPVLGMHLPALFPSFMPPNAGMLQDFPLHLSARLGLPLVFSISGNYPGDDHTEDEIGLLDAPYNQIMQHLSITKSASGAVEARMMGGLPRPNIVIRRADGKRLTVSHVMMMYIFIEEQVVKVEKLTKATDVDWAVFFAKMTPENFVARWEKEDGTQWAVGECPVKLGCKICGKMVEKIVLLRCGKCGTARYCGRECQKSDWKLHKKMCSKWVLMSDWKSH